MGSKTKKVAKIKELIIKNNPKAKKFLELACGTGTILKLLPKKYELHGLDLSENMLAIAKQKLPRAKLYHQNMVSFKLPEKFDVVFCVSDSINHVLKFSDWKKIFANSYKHLNNSGIFIFDINTEQELKRLVAEEPWVQKFGKNYMVIEVTAEVNGIVNWNIKVFERQQKNKYRLLEENIKERSFPAEKIKNVLRKIYSGVKVYAVQKRLPRKFTKRLYFVCKK